MVFLLLMNDLSVLRLPCLCELSIIWLYEYLSVQIGVITVSWLLSFGSVWFRDGTDPVFDLGTSGTGMSPERNIPQDAGSLECLYL